MDRRALATITVGIVGLATLGGIVGAAALTNTDTPPSDVTTTVVTVPSTSTVSVTVPTTETPTTTTAAPPPVTVPTTPPATTTTAGRPTDANGNPLCQTVEREWIPCGRNTDKTTYWDPNDPNTVTTI